MGMYVAQILLSDDKIEEMLHLPISNALKDTS